MSLTGFYVRRARRLLPALYAVVIVAVLAGWITGIAFAPAWDVVGALTYSSNIVEAVVHPDHGARMLGHVWSLVIEEQFYLLWPAVMLTFWRRRRLLIGMLAVVVVVSPLLRLGYWLQGDWQSTLFNPFARVDAILAGCILALLLRDRAAVPTISRWMPWVAILVWLLLATGGDGPVFTAGLSVAACTAAIVLLSAVGGRAPGFLSWGWLAGLGRVSYGVYLWHHVVLMFVVHQYGITGWVGLVVTVLPATVVLTALSWVLIEQPALRWRRGGGSVCRVEPAQDEPDQSVVLPGERLHLGEGLRVRR